MLKPPTGEPCAGEPHARFGGRGGDTLPDPYQNNPTARHSGESRNPEKRHGKQFPRFIEKIREKHIFLKTIIPSRKATRDYQREQGEQ